MENEKDSLHYFHLSGGYMRNEFRKILPKKIDEHNKNASKGEQMELVSILTKGLETTLSKVGVLKCVYCGYVFEWEEGASLFGTTADFIDAPFCSLDHFNRFMENVDDEYIEKKRLLDEILYRLKETFDIITANQLKRFHKRIFDWLYLIGD